jgi:hypothetical protein
MMSPFPYHERFEGTQTLFHQRLVILEEAIPAAPEEVRPTLVMIRRSAIDLHSRLGAIDIASSLPSTSFGNISCFDCGTRSLQVFHSSKQSGYQLCSPCFDHRASTGRARSAH